MFVVLILALLPLGGVIYESFYSTSTPVQIISVPVEHQRLASDELNKLDIKGRAPKTGYSRDQFGDGWAQIDGCDTRNLILKNSLDEVILDQQNNCSVISGILDDPYAGKRIEFRRGPGTSRAVQIDHVVALSDSWQKGARHISKEIRVQFANDSLNLLAVDGPANQQKGDGDAATWLPTNKSYRCRYVARQIAVKVKYLLWVTKAEHESMKRILDSCPGQLLPIMDEREK